MLLLTHIGTNTKLYAWVPWQLIYNHMFLQKNIIGLDRMFDCWGFDSVLTLKRQKVAPGIDFLTMDSLNISKPSSWRSSPSQRGGWVSAQDTFGLHTVKSGPEKCELFFAVCHLPLLDGGKTVGESGGPRKVAVFICALCTECETLQYVCEYTRFSVRTVGVELYSCNIMLHCKDKA